MFGQMQARLQFDLNAATLGIINVCNVALVFISLWFAIYARNLRLLSLQQILKRLKVEGWLVEGNPPKFQPSTS